MADADLVNKLATMLQTQHERLEVERKDAIKREEKMQQLLERALQKPTQQEGKIPSNATPAPMLLHNASLREFTTWRQKFNDYMLLTGIDKASVDRQKAVLRSLLDDEWFRIAKFALNIKMEDANITVEQIINQMLEHLRSQRNIVLDRKEFYSRDQQPGEKFDDYYVALQEIAAFCDFCATCINQQYRDKIVMGVNHEETVKNLLSEKNLTLEKAVAICRANENAMNDTESLQASASGINRVAKYKKARPQQNSAYTNRSWRPNEHSPEQRRKFTNSGKYGPNAAKRNSDTQWREDRSRDGV